jgi:hypothetical protein
MEGNVRKLFFVKISFLFDLRFFMSTRSLIYKYFNVLFRFSSLRKIVFLNHQPNLYLTLAIIYGHLLKPDFFKLSLYKIVIINK